MRNFKIIESTAHLALLEQHRRRVGLGAELLDATRVAQSAVQGGAAGRGQLHEVVQLIGSIGRGTQERLVKSTHKCGFPDRKESTVGRSKRISWIVYRKLHQNTPHFEHTMHFLLFFLFIFLVIFNLFRYLF